MKTVTIDVASVIKSHSALTREQGTLVYNKIVHCLNDGDKVTLDFKDIKCIIIPFLNVSIGNLYEDFSSLQLNDNLEVKNLPEGTNSKFQMVIKNAKQFYWNKRDFEKVVEEVINN